jgi:hypothetical protein
MAGMRIKANSDFKALTEPGISSRKDRRAGCPARQRRRPRSSALSSLIKSPSQCFFGAMKSIDQALYARY